MRRLVAILVALAACTDDGDTPGLPFDGDASGQYGSDSFDPRFAVAFTNPEGKLELQFGEAAISCERHLHDGAGNPLGLFVRVIVAAPTLGEQRGAWVEYDALTRSGTHQTGSNDGTVVLDTLDDARAAGTVMHMRTDDKLGTLAFDGTFSVTRCP